MIISRQRIGIVQMDVPTRGAHVANQVGPADESLPGLSGMIGKRGTAVFTATSGSVAVLGLHFSGSAFNSIPAQQRCNNLLSLPRTQPSRGS